MELKGRRLGSVKRFYYFAIIFPLEKARKRITMAVSAGTLEITKYEHKWQKHCRIAFKYTNLYGEKRLCLLCIIGKPHLYWLTSLILE